MYNMFGLTEGKIVNGVFFNQVITCEVWTAYINTLYIFAQTSVCASYVGN